MIENLFYATLAVITYLCTLRRFNEAFTALESERKDVAIMLADKFLSASGGCEECDPDYFLRLVILYDAPSVMAAIGSVAPKIAGKYIRTWDAQKYLAATARNIFQSAQEVDRG